MKLLVTLVFCAFSMGSQAQYWIQKSSFGGVGRHRAVGCATENKEYLGLGHVNGTGVDGGYGQYPGAEYFKRANERTFVASAAHLES